MKILDIKPKVLQELRISDRLVQALKEMSRLILDKDDMTLKISDDAMQDSNGVVIGGLVDKENKLYDFTCYTPESDKHADTGDSNPDQIWQLRLTDVEIHAITEGRLTLLKLWTCKDVECVHAEHRKDFTCLRCDFYDDGKPKPPNPQYLKS